MFAVRTVFMDICAALYFRALKNLIMYEVKNNIQFVFMVISRRFTFGISLSCENRENKSLAKMNCRS